MRDGRRGNEQKQGVIEGGGQGSQEFSTKQWEQRENEGSVSSQPTRSQGKNRTGTSMCTRNTSQRDGRLAKQSATVSRKPPTRVPHEESRARPTGRLYVPNLLVLMKVLFEEHGALGREGVAHGGGGARHLVGVGVAPLRADGLHLSFGGRVNAACTRQKKGDGQKTTTTTETERPRGPINVVSHFGRAKSLARRFLPKKATPLPVGSTPEGTHRHQHPKPTIPVCRGGRTAPPLRTCHVLDGVHKPVEHAQTTELLLLYGHVGGALVGRPRRVGAVAVHQPRAHRGAGWVNRESATGKGGGRGREGVGMEGGREGGGAGQRRKNDSGRRREGSSGGD